MLRLLLALSALGLLSIASSAHSNHHDQGRAVHIPPPPPHHPPPHHNGHNGRWRRGLAAAAAAESDESEEREVKKEWQRAPARHAFLSGLPADARKAFVAIKMNDELSRDEKREQMMDWAGENGVEDALTAHLAARDDEIRARREATVAAIDDLPEAYEKLSPIFLDSSLTRREQARKAEEITSEYSEELKSLLRAALPCYCRHDRRHHNQWRISHSRRHHGARRGFAEQEALEF